MKSVCTALIASLTLYAGGALATEIVGITTTAQFDLTSNELQQLEKDALDGDSKSAVRLVKYYRFYHNNYQLDRFWLQIAAENGDAAAEADFSIYLNSDLPARNPDTRKQDAGRTCFWLRKAVTDGFPKVKIYSEYRQKCSISDK
jgi:TPR repeat protein